MTTIETWAEAQYTTEQFDEKLEEIVSSMFAADLLAIPGVYEALAEALNNEILDALEADCAAAVGPEETKKRAK